MAEEHPESPTTAVRIYVAGLALACAFRAVDHYEWPWTTDSAISAGLSAVLTVGDWKLPWILQKAGPRATRLLNLLAADPRWWVVSILIYLLIGTFSTFIEEKRWPFSAWLPNQDPAEVAAITKDRDDLRRQLAAKIKDEADARNTFVTQVEPQLTILENQTKALVAERDQLKQQLATAQSQLQDSNRQLEDARRAAHQPPPPAPPEGIDEMIR